MANDLPDVDFKISDGGLGQLGVGNTTTTAVIGTSVLGTPNTFYAFTDVEDVRTKLGGGPGAEAVGVHLRAGGGTVYFVGASATIPGSNGTIGYLRSSSGSPSTGMVSVAGTASSSAQIVIKISSATPAAISTGSVMYQLSIDGGVTFGTAVALASSGQITSSGLTFSLSGLFFQNDNIRVNAVSGSPVVSAPILTHATGPVSTGTVSVTGSPGDAYQVVVQATYTGIVESGSLFQFRYSLDGGSSFSQSVSCPSSGIYVLPNTGLTLTFAGFFNQDDIASFATTAPGYSLSDAQAAYSVLEHQPLTYLRVHFVGAPTGSTSAVAAQNCAIFGTGVAALLEDSVHRYRFARAFVDGSDSTDSELISAFANVVSTRLSVGAGFIDITSALNGRTMKRNCQWAHVARLSSSAISTHPGFVADGGLQAVTKIYRDEGAQPIMDVNRFVTTRIHPGRAGFYITRGRMMANPGSDYQQVMNCQVMDVACTIARTAGLQFLNGKVPAERGTGFIRETSAQAMETYVGSEMGNVLMLEPDVSSVSIVIKRDWNIVSTGRMPTKVRMLPLGYLEHIEMDMGFDLAG